MNRKIMWKSDSFDEIELVYEKAQTNSKIENSLEALEEKALEEAQLACSNGGLLAAQVGAVLTKEQFYAMSSINIETSIKMLSALGFGSLDIDISSAQIFITLTSRIQNCMGCTVFEILNRLEKLDGSVNILKPNWTLQLRVPLGGKKGLLQWEILIMQLYPWISVNEVASNEVAVI